MEIFPARVGDEGFEMIEAMKLALEALEDWKTYMHGHWDVIDEQAITSLRQAIAEAERKSQEFPKHFDTHQSKQEPIAWRLTPRYEDSDGFFDFTDSEETAQQIEKKGWSVQPLYTHSPKRERVVFPTMLRKMWSGGEVQAWLDEHVNKEQS
jgi:hypothetical protein